MGNQSILKVIHTLERFPFSAITHTLHATPQRTQRASSRVRQIPKNRYHHIIHPLSHPLLLLSPTQDTRLPTINVYSFSRAADVSAGRNRAGRVGDGQPVNPQSHSNTRTVSSLLTPTRYTPLATITSQHLACGEFQGPKPFLTHPRRTRGSRPSTCTASRGLRMSLPTPLSG